MAIEFNNNIEMVDFVNLIYTHSLWKVYSYFFMNPLKVSSQDNRGKPGTLWLYKFYSISQ